MKGYRSRVRPAAVLLLLTLGGFAAAERVVTVPTATKIPFRGLRFEVQGTPSRDATRGWIGWGVTQTIEAELSLESYNSDKLTPGFNFAYNFVLPITDVSPGISVGVHDLANHTRDGRAVYLAVTYRLGNDSPQNQDTPTEVSFGVWSRETGAAFVGLRLPLTNELRFLAEHNAVRPTAGLEFRPGPAASFRMLFDRDGTTVGLTFAKRF